MTLGRVNAGQGRARDPDARLVAGIARGDPDAARSLVDRHLARMVAIGRRMLGDEAEAEDVAQEVFLRVWKHSGSWKPGAARFETWMHRVAINLCYDRLRRKREVVTDTPPERADDAPSALTTLQRHDVSRRVERAVTALPPRQRAAIALCHYEEMSNIEAASVLDVSVEAVESLLSRARRSLRLALSDEASELMSEIDDQG